MCEHERPDAGLRRGRADSTGKRDGGPAVPGKRAGRKTEPAKGRKSRRERKNQDDECNLDGCGGVYTTCRNGQGVSGRQQKVARGMARIGRQRGLGRRTRKVQEENKSDTRAKQEETEKATRVQPASITRATRSTMARTPVGFCGLGSCLSGGSAWAGQISGQRVLAPKALQRADSLRKERRASLDSRACACMIPPHFEQTVHWEIRNSRTAGNQT